MLELENKITLTNEIIESFDLCHLFSAADLEKIGAWVYDGYQRDEDSRKAWKERNQAAMDLAMQITPDKNFPWPDCSNVAFPLVTIAVQQFHARAYPTLVSGPDIVKCRIIGDDPQGKEKKRAQRVSTHMSYQVLEEDAGWEPQHDRLLINLGCVGSAYKKTYYQGINKSDLVLAKDLVMNYYSKSVNDCPRKTHIIPQFRNDIYEKVKREMFRDVLDEPWFSSIPSVSSVGDNIRKDQRQGITPPQPDYSTPFITLEQHCDLDLDGDGYAEPYIITIEADSQSVLRIVTRFTSQDDIERNDDGEIITINAREYFTDYTLIPSPDGGIYGIGFGLLLGPLNESVNSLINQLIDAGTMVTTAGGFLGRGAKIRGGDYTFSPLEWKRVDSTADDLRKSIFPLPVREPSQVLFQLLQLLIQYTNRVSGSTEMMAGENPGQNTPAQTSQTMVEQGMKMYSAIFKRIWRSMKEEFKKLYVLNGIYLPLGRAVAFKDGDTSVYRDDYLGDPDRIVPAADPHVTSDQMGLQKAQMIAQRAQVSSGYNLEEVERDILRAMKVDSIDRIYPGPGKVQPLSNPKVQIEQMKMEHKKQELELQKMEFVASIQEEMKVNAAKIIQLQAQAVKFVAEAKGVESGHAVAAMNAQISAMKNHNDLMTKKVELILKGMEVSKDGNSGEGGMESMVAKPMHQGASPSNEGPQGAIEGAALGG